MRFGKNIRALAQCESCRERGAGLWWRGRFCWPLPAPDAQVSIRFSFEDSGTTVRFKHPIWVRYDTFQRTRDSFTRELPKTLSIVTSRSHRHPVSTRSQTPNVAESSIDTAVSRDAGPRARVLGRAQLVVIDGEGELLRAGRQEAPLLEARPRELGDVAHARALPAVERAPYRGALRVSRRDLSGGELGACV